MDEGVDDRFQERTVWQIQVQDVVVGASAAYKGDTTFISTGSTFRADHIATSFIYFHNIIGIRSLSAHTWSADMSVSCYVLSESAASSISVPVDEIRISLSVDYHLHDKMTVALEVREAPGS